MPMFAWHAFRGTLREATLLLTLVGGHRHRPDGAASIGPIYALGDRYGLAPELVGGVLQLFLLDCGLILLPLSVMVTQQRIVGRARRRRARDAAAAGRRRPPGRRSSRPARTAGSRCSTPAPRRCSATSPTRCIGELPDMFHPAGRAASPGLPAAGAAELRRHLPGLGRRRRRHQAVALPAQGRRGTHDADDAHRACTASRGELTGLPRHRRGRHRARGRATARCCSTLEHQRTRWSGCSELERVQGRLRRRRSATSCGRRSPASSATPRLLEDGAVGELTLSQQRDRRPGRPQRPPAAAARRGPADALPDRVLGAEDRAGRHRRPHRRDERARERSRPPSPTRVPAT